MRVGIEDEAINGSRVLGNLLGISADEALGKLARFWHTTQNMEVHEASGQFIYFSFCETQSLTKEDVLSALETCGYIYLIKADTYGIRGNKKHIDKRKDLKKRQSNGGRKSAISRNIEVGTSSAPAKLYSKLYYTKKKRIDADASHSTGVETDLRAPLSLVDLWNQHCGRLAKVRKPVSPARERKIRARWKETPPGEKPVDYWTAVVKRIAASDFCCGKNQNGWRASFDWILQPEVREKVLEGKYDTRSGTEAIDWSKVFGDEK